MKRKLVLFLTRTTWLIRGIIKCLLFALTGVNLFFGFFGIFFLVCLLSVCKGGILSLMFTIMGIFVFLSIPYGIGYTWEYFEQNKYAMAFLYGLLPSASIYTFSLLSDLLKNYI